MSLLQNKIALITGGTTGIGLATAKRFTAEGARVIVTGRNPDTLQQAREQLGQEVAVWASDASDADAVAALFERVKTEFGGLDVLFLNAGIALFAPLAQSPVELFDRQFSTNVRGPWLALRAASTVLNDNASVFLNASALHARGLAGGSAYAATKAAVRSIVRTAASELSPRGIRVNTISPGPIDTPIYSKLGMDAEAIAAFANGIKEQVPLKRFGTSDEVAGAALFLASGLSSYVTGIDLPVDGGMAQV